MVVFFTDGSKSSGGCGAGVASPEMRIFNPFRLPNECEAFAILKAAETLLSLEIAEKKIAICTDSQAALKAISSLVIKSKLTLNCLGMLNIAIVT